MTRTTKTFKPGTRVLVIGFGWNGEPVYENAKIVRSAETVRALADGTLPAGYHLIRYETGGRMHAHESHLAMPI